MWGVGWLHWPCVSGSRPRPNGIDAPSNAREMRDRGKQSSMRRARSPYRQRTMLVPPSELARRTAGIESGFEGKWSSWLQRPRSSRSWAKGRIPYAVEPKRLIQIQMEDSVS